MSDGKSGLQLRSLVKKSGELELSLVNIPTPEPAATRSWFASRRRRSIRPTSGCCSAPADMTTAKARAARTRRSVTAKVPEAHAGDGRPARPVDAGRQ